MKRRGNRGIALIMVVGILGLISIVAVSFAVNMQMDLKASRNYTNNVKAGYLAEAGIARAVAELKYGSEGAVGNAVDSASEGWYSGYSDSSPLGGAGSYTAAIIDCSRNIDINNTRNPNLARMLLNLNAALGSPLADTDCQDIVSNAPYLTPEELRSKSGISEDKYNAIKDFISLYGWADPDVINPQDTAAPYAAQPRTPININTASAEVLQAVFQDLSDGNNSISASEARALASHMISGRPYAARDEVWTRLLSAEPSIINGGDAAVVMANCDPNTDLMRLNPNNSWRYRHISKSNSKDGVDKTALAVNTTELSFDSGGYYEITSVGQLRDTGGSKTAERKLVAAVRVFDIWRQTTQSQFEGGRSSVPSGGAGATGTDNRAVETYPEPPQGSYAATTDYDGQIVLAGNSLSNAGNVSYLKAGFSTDLRAEGYGGDAANYSDARSNARVIDASDRGDLMPDGCLTKRDNAASKLGYRISGNAYNRSGTFEVWLKPDWDAAALRNNSATCVLFSFANMGPGITEADGGGYLCSYVFYNSWSGQLEWRLQARPYRRVISPQPANIYGFYYGLPSEWGIGKWQHYAVTWDYSVDTDSTAVLMYIDGIQRTSLVIAGNANQGGCFGAFNGSNLMGLGWDPDSGANHVDATMDEVRVYDYVKGASEIAADYLDGIYYDASDAVFTSSSKDVGSATLGSISWTEHIPAEIGGADIEFDVYDGSSWQNLSLSDPSGGGLDIPVSGPVKYKASFRETDTGLRDTPVLDDVTITYMKKTEILYWRRL